MHRCMNNSVFAGKYVELKNERMVYTYSMWLGTRENTKSSVYISVFIVLFNTVVSR
jgi:hypothetical protein